MNPPTPRHVLAIDTAMGQCAAALYDPVSKECTVHVEQMLHGHAGRLVPLIDELLKTCGESYDSLGLIAVTTGPGSFTGLRVGLSCARGLALALDTPIRGFGTLDTLAAQILSLPSEDETERPSDARPDTILSLIETRRDNLFWQTFDARGNPLSPPQDSAPEDIPLAQNPALCGDGVTRFIERRPEAGRLYAPASCRSINVGFLAERAAQEETEGDPPRPAVPLYVRPPDVSV